MHTTPTQEVLCEVSMIHTLKESFVKEVESS